MFYAKSTGGFYTVDIHGESIPLDAVAITDEAHAALLEGQSQGKLIQGDGNGMPILVAPPPPTQEQLFANLNAATQQRLDAFAQTRGYAGILSAVSYAGSTSGKYKAEGQYATAARDNTWAKRDEIFAAVEAGTRSMPTLDEFLAELPALTWPK